MLTQKDATVARVLTCWTFKASTDQCGIPTNQKTTQRSLRADMWFCMRTDVRTYGRIRSRSYLTGDRKYRRLCLLSAHKSSFIHWLPGDMKAMLRMYFSKSFLELIYSAFPGKLVLGQCLKAIDDKSTLIQVVAWCCQAPSHYLNQCWLRSLSISNIYITYSYIYISEKDCSSSIVNAPGLPQSCAKPFIWLQLFLQIYSLAAKMPQKICHWSNFISISVSLWSAQLCTFMH